MDTFDRLNGMKLQLQWIDEASRKAEFVLTDLETGETQVREAVEEEPGHWKEPISSYEMIVF